eukprot:354212-Chlamydomonas_euryale.AAC.8
MSYTVSFAARLCARSGMSPCHDGEPGCTWRHQRACGVASEGLAGLLCMEWGGSVMDACHRLMGLPERRATHICAD